MKPPQPYQNMSSEDRLHNGRVSRALLMVEAVPLGAVPSTQYFLGSVERLLSKKQVGTVLELLERVADWLRFRGLAADAARVDDEIVPSIVSLFEGS